MSLEDKLRDIYDKNQKDNEIKIKNEIRETFEGLFKTYCYPKIKNIEDIAKNQTELDIFNYEWNKLFINYEFFNINICGKNKYIRFSQKTTDYLFHNYNEGNLIMRDIVKKYIKEIGGNIEKIDVCGGVKYYWN